MRRQASALRNFNIGVAYVSELKDLSIRRDIPDLTPAGIWGVYHVQLRSAKNQIGILTRDFDCWEILKLFNIRRTIEVGGCQVPLVFSGIINFHALIHCLSDLWIFISRTAISDDYNLIGVLKRDSSKTLSWLLHAGDVSVPISFFLNSRNSNPFALVQLHAIVSLSAQSIKAFAKSNNLEFPSLVVEFFGVSHDCYLFGLRMISNSVGLIGGKTTCNKEFVWVIWEKAHCWVMPKVRVIGVVSRDVFVFYPLPIFDHLEVVFKVIIHNSCLLVCAEEVDLSIAQVASEIFSPTLVRLHRIKLSSVPTILAEKIMILLWIQLGMSLELNHLTRLQFFVLRNNLTLRATFLYVPTHRELWVQ